MSKNTQCFISEKHLSFPEQLLIYFLIIIPFSTTLLIAREEQKDFLFEKLHIGKIGLTDDDIFGFINSIAFTESDGFIAADIRFKNIKCYTSDGKLKWSFSKNGQGPGEMPRHKKLWVNSGSGKFPS